MKQGAGGVPRDALAAKHYHERAIAKGHASDMNNLTVLLEQGAERVSKNASSCKNLLLKSCG